MLDLILDAMIHEDKFVSIIVNGILRLGEVLAIILHHVETKQPLVQNPNKEHGR